MKNLLCLILFAAASVATAQEAWIRRRPSSLPSLSQRLNGITEWRMGAETLTISDSGAVTRLAGPRGPILEIPEPESVREVVPSRNGKYLLLRVMRERPSGGGDYSRIVRVSRDSAGNWGWQTFLAKESPPMETRHRGVAELGAISDTGSMVLLKLGEADQEATPYRMTYSWQTWKLEPPVKVADGIRLPDDFDK